MSGQRKAHNLIKEGGKKKEKSVRENVGLTGGQGEDLPEMGKSPEPGKKKKKKKMERYPTTKRNKRRRKELEFHSV